MNKFRDWLSNYIERLAFFIASDRKRAYYAALANEMNIIRIMLYAKGKKQSGFISPSIH